MILQKGDFIELTYTGKINNTEKKIFDTTDAELAKKEDLFDPKGHYGAITIVLGENHVLPGLDKALEGKEVGTYSFDVEAKDGFGIKSGKNLQLVPTKFFTKDNIRPFVGLQVNIDNQMGIVRSISGGRVIVDFNHPLASQDLIYDVTVNKKIEDPAEQVKSLFALYGLAIGDDVKIEGDKVIITTKAQLPVEFTKPLMDMIQDLTKLKTVEFAVVKTVAKPVAKPVAKAEVKTEVKAETQSEVPSEVPSEVKPAEEASEKSEE